MTLDRIIKYGYVSDPESANEYHELSNDKEDELKPTTPKFMLDALKPEFATMFLFISTLETPIMKIHDVQKVHLLLPSSLTDLVIEFVLSTFIKNMQRGDPFTHSQSKTVF